MNASDRERYLLYSQLNQFKRRVESARRLIENFIGGELDDRRNGQGSRGLTPRQVYVSTSWGKDSTVLLDITARVLGPRETNALSVMYGTPRGDGWEVGPFDRWPDLLSVRDAFLERTPVCYRETFVESFWSLCERYDCRPVTVDMSGAGKNIGEVENRFIRSFFVAIDNLARALGYTGNLIGMRREESANRRRHFSMRGHTYWASGREMWCCCPLHGWTGDDVWAYIVSHDLPYSGLYDAAGFDRNTLRNGLMIGGGMMRRGAYVHIKRLYPELWNAACARYPYLRAFSG